MPLVALFAPLLALDDVAAKVGRPLNPWLPLAAGALVVLPLVLFV